MSREVGLMLVFNTGFYFVLFLKFILLFRSSRMNRGTWFHQVITSACIPHNADRYFYIYSLDPSAISYGIFVFVTSNLPRAPVRAISYCSSDYTQTRVPRLDVNFRHIWFQKT